MEASPRPHYQHPEAAPRPHYQHPAPAHARCGRCGEHSTTTLERRIRARNAGEGSGGAGGGCDGGGVGDRPQNSLPCLAVVPPCSRSSSASVLQPPPPPEITLSQSDQSMMVVMSALYAKLLIVLGIALPVTSTIKQERNSAIASDVYFLYLYIGSLLFLAYIFYHLRVAKREMNKYVKRRRYGSFYLHMGVAGFSVGSTVYSCLQIGEYFDLSGDCRHVLVAVKPAARILFTVTQTIFIFSYTDVLDPTRGVVLDRFGLMHLIATNVCEWLNVVIQETKDDIYTIAYGPGSLPGRFTVFRTPVIINPDGSSNITQDDVALLEDVNVSVDSSQPCNVSDMIVPLVRSANPYLRTCGVEYSLLCAIIVAVIWKDVGTALVVKATQSDFAAHEVARSASRQVKSANHFSVDCAGSHKGLFAGVAVLAGTIVSLMLFHGLFREHVEVALLQMNIWETAMFACMAVASAACMVRTRTLALRTTAAHLPLEHSLLLVTQSGVYLYYLFTIIGATIMIERYPDNRRATRIIAPVCALVQSSLQTLLVLEAWSRRCSAAQVRQKPGRQLLTFLLIGNFAMWLLNRVKNTRAEFHPLPMELFGVWAWTLMTHVSVPLLVCYRFQATVCIYEIWKYAYKPLKQPSAIREETTTLGDDVELKVNLP